MTEATEQTEEIVVDDSGDEMFLEEEDTFYLTAEENLALLLYDARIKNAELSKRLRMKEYELEEMTGKFEATHRALRLLQLKNNLKQFIKEQEAEIVMVANEMKDKKEEVESRLGVNLEECSFQEETGKLIKIPE